MGLEKPTTAALEQKHLDDAWFQEYQNTALFEELGLLSGSPEFRKRQKEEFLSGKIENPSLDYPKLDAYNFDREEQGLLALKKEIIAEEKNEVVKQLYRWKINERIAKLRGLRATQSGNDKKFTRYSKFVYGEPEKEIYDFTLSQIKQSIDEKLFSSDPAISSAAQRLNAELFEALMENESSIDPKAYDFPEMKADPNEKEYSAEEIKTVFEQYLQEKQIGGWVVSVDEQRAGMGISINQGKKAVSIPSDRTLSHSKLQARLAHELGTHVLRRERGERSRLLLLGTGLDRYLKGEEGVATYNQQIASGTKGFRGLDYHFAISLAVGMDGKKRNFRQVFEILKDYHFINSEKEGEAAAKYAEGEAWDDCIFTFRGTTGKTPGTCNTRNIVYREGNIGVWNIVKNNPEEIRRFSIGKFDPTNPRHIWILEQLEITDEDLENLENLSEQNE